MARKNKKKRIKSILIWSVFLCVWASLVIVYLAESKLIRLVPGGWGESFSTKIFAAPSVLKSNSFSPLPEIFERLQRVHYQPGKMGQLVPGEYLWSDPILVISLRGFSTPVASQEEQVVKMVRWEGTRWELKDAEGKSINQVILEPEMLAELSGPLKVRREPATWGEIPPQLVDAVVAIEDRRFFTHHGIDIRSIVRAAVNNVRNRKKLQGGSTITQQLAKNLFLTHRRTMSRKILEAFLALYLDVRYSKQDILTLYLNHIYLGQDGFFSVAGVKSAAQFYFNKEVKNLSLDECALLAGLIRSPYRYNPNQNPKRAKERRDTVLKVMEETNAITAEERKGATLTPLKITRAPSIKQTANENDYFVAEVVRRMLPRYSEDMLFRYGLRIDTTLDPFLQRQAHAAVKKTAYQAALVAISLETGKVVALVGGKNYQESQFNRATQAKRQPGSGFKPFVYGAGLENGLTPATLLNDRPRAYTNDKTKGIWAPQNFDGNFRGPISLRKALAQSINGATLDLAEKIGVNSIIYFARKMGIESDLRRDLTTALGSSEVTLFELATAYLPFANGGFRITPILVNSVQDIENQVLEVGGIERKPVIAPALAYLMTSLLESTIKEGTAKILAQWGWHYPAAGKTGTTNEGKDAWFIGYTSDLLVGVWVGSDDAAAIHVSGTKDALPIWMNFMTGVSSSNPPLDFVQPHGLKTVKIDPVSGLLARSGCPDRREEIFIEGTEPNEQCDLHAGGFKGWLQRIFRKKTPAVKNETIE